MLKKLSLICLLSVCLCGFTLGCSQGPSDVVVDKSLKEKKLGSESGKKASEHDGAAQVD